MQKFFAEFEFGKYKKWIYTGVALSAASAVIGYHFLMKQNSTKTGIFNRQIKKLAHLIYTQHGDTDRICPLVKVRSKKLKSDSSKLVMNAHLVQNLKKKEQITEKNDSFIKDDPFLPPFEKGMFITEIGEHRVLYNKFPVVKNHVLVVSKNFED